MGVVTDLAGRVLAVRLDSTGDFLLMGPAIRALAAAPTVSTVDVLAGPAGSAAARLLPGVRDVLVWTAPWVVSDPPPTTSPDVAAVVARVRAGRFDAAVVFTSFHQSPLPTALVLRLAGVPWIAAASADYPGSLLDLRHRPPSDGPAGDVPETERALDLARAAGADLPPGDDGRLALRPCLPDIRHLVPARPYVVVHPGAAVPSRAWPPGRCREAVPALAAAGWSVVVTGGPGERELTAAVAGSDGVDLGGATDLAGLAGVLAGARAVVVGNTGPAHLAAAVGTPVVSLFAPVVPAARWRPYGVPHVLLGDQDAPCRDTRARLCPVPGHPCLAGVTPTDVVAAVATLARGGGAVSPPCGGNP